jgi:large subunit ribosomal protein L19
MKLLDFATPFVGTVRTSQIRQPHQTTMTASLAGALAVPVMTQSSAITPTRCGTTRAISRSHQMNLIAQIDAEQVATLGKTLPDFKAGDTIRVGYKVTEGTRSRVQNYEGVCIARKNGKGIAGSFTVRKISFGEGVERVFPLHSTNIDEITVVRRGKVRRAKLYYLRERRGKSARIAEVSNYKSPKA